MKKILSIFAALAIAVGVASAQNVNYEYAGPFGMPYVNVNGGVVSSLNVENFGEFVNGVKPVAGLEVGTYFTPVWGASVEGLGFLKTTTSRTLFSESAVLANGKVNFSNLLAGYKGQPRVVEVVGVLGYGWGHDYVAKSYGQYRSSETPIIVDGYSEEVVGPGVLATDKNYTVYKAGAELNFNLGEARAWQINFRPGVLWFHKEAGNYVSSPVMTTKRDGRVYVEAGLTYKFGNRRTGSHNFVTNNYAVTKADYDALKDKYNDALNREPEVREVVKKVTLYKEVVETETKVLVGSNIIDTIDYSSKDVMKYVAPDGKVPLHVVGTDADGNEEKAKVEAFAKSLDTDTLVHVLGSADSKTGSETRNFALAKNRANVVKNALVGYGVAEDRIETSSTVDATDNVLTSRSAVVTLSVK